MKAYSMTMAQFLNGIVGGRAIRENNRRRLHHADVAVMRELTSMRDLTPAERVVALEAARALEGRS